MSNTCNGAPKMQRSGAIRHAFGIIMASLIKEEKFCHHEDRYRRRVEGNKLRYLRYESEVIALYYNSSHIFGPR